MTCPHCGDQTMEAGVTGLDLCTHCGGLSRAGHALRRNPAFEGFEHPRMVNLRYIDVHGFLVQSALTDAGPSVVISFVLADGRQLPPMVATAEVAGALARHVAEAAAHAERTTSN